MLSLNATQLAIVANSYKKVSWLFTVVDVDAGTAGPTTYYWSTITKSYGGHSYVYKIDPTSFNGITLNRAGSEINIQAPNDLSFDIENSGNTLTASNFIGGTVTLDLVISDGTDEEIICSWKFNIKRCEAVYQKLAFTCEDFIQQYLEGDYPNTKLIKDINPSTDPDVDDNICVPRPIGTCYIPLRTLYITDQRYYLLGLTSTGTYTITKVRSPRSWGAGKSEWDSGSYSFTQSTKAIDGVNWRVFQAIICDSDGNGSADANGLWRNGDYFLDMPTKFSCSDTSAKTNPADAIEFILEDMGIASADIDTGAGSSFEAAATTFTSWGLTFNGAFYKKRSREQVLAMLLNSCHSTLQITDKIELHVLSKTSQKTITKADVLRTVDAGAGTFKYSLITKKQSDSGYIEFQITDESQDEFIKKLVPAKASTDNISSEILNIPLVQDTQDAQTIGTLYYQRKLLKKANIPFTNKGGTLLALQPDDIITINHADYGGNYPVLVNSMSIKHDLSISFNCIQFSVTLDDWADLSPSVITPEVDDSGFVFNSAGNRVFSVQPYPPYDVGDLWVGGPSGDIKRCKTARSSGGYQAGDWELASEYDNTLDQLSGRGVNVCNARYSSFEEADKPPTYSGDGTVTQDSGISYFGGNSLKMAASAANHYCYLGVTGIDYNVKITPNKKWIISVYNRCSAISKDIDLYVRTKDSGTFYKVDTTSHGTADTWKRVSGIIDLTSDDSTQCMIRLDNDGDNGVNMWWDGIMLEEQYGNLEVPSAYALPSAIMAGWDSQADNTGTAIENSAASMLYNWNLTIPNVDELPAGIYPISNITDFSQVDFLDSNYDSIKILSTPDTMVAYGFPAIPIDDKNKYTITIRHKSSAACIDGLYLRLDQYNADLPAGKTHIGHSSGGVNTQTRTNYVDLVDNGAMPGTSWVVNTYTYTPTSGTKYASFSMYNNLPDTAGVEYHVDYVLMYVSYTEADNTEHANDTDTDTTFAHNIDGDLNINGGGTIYFKNNTPTTLGQIGGIGVASIFKIDSTSGNQLTVEAVNAILALTGGTSIETKGKIEPADLTPKDFGSTTNRYANAFTNTVATRQALAASGNSNGSMIIGVTNTDAARTVTLLTADCISGKIIIIKDESGGANTHNITVATQGSENIDGSATKAITGDYGRLGIYSDGSNWFIFLTS